MSSLLHGKGKRVSVETTSNEPLTLKDLRDLLSHADGLGFQDDHPVQTIKEVSGTGRLAPANVTNLFVEDYQPAPTPWGQA